jgi:cytidine deaminase
MTSQISLAPESIQGLYREALQVRTRAYAPYSGCQVGAALLTTEGKIYSGCNIENSSFGATVCAERVAVFQAVSQNERLRIQQIIVVTDATPPWPPCGICRQVLCEFGENITVHTANLQGDWMTYRWENIFPLAFTPEHLTELKTPHLIQG